MFVVVVTLDVRKRKLKKSPDIISRGFIYLRESQQMLSQTRDLVTRTVEEFMKENKGKIEFDELKKEVQRKTSRYLRQKTDKEPIVIPVILSL